MATSTTRAAVLLVLLVGACGPAAIPSGINDPHEVSNRRVHDFNKGLGPSRSNDAETGADPVSEESTPPVDTDEDVIPESADVPLEATGRGWILLANFGGNLDNPRRILNSLLQVRPGDAAHNTLRLGINSTVGILGIFDVAGAAGLPEIDTDFGETLHVWGVQEGAYQELPVFGPSTQRDTAGAVVDFAINPLWYIFPWPQNLVANGFVWAGEATDLVRYSETVNSILYDSADSYAQSRLIYLQNRRFELSRGKVSEDDESVDLYEELYGD